MADRLCITRVDGVLDFACPAKFAILCKYISATQTPAEQTTPCGPSPSQLLIIYFNSCRFESDALGIFSAAILTLATLMMGAVSHSSTVTTLVPLNTVVVSEQQPDWHSRGDRINKCMSDSHWQILRLVLLMLFSHPLYLALSLFGITLQHTPLIPLNHLFL